jgi:hypothetical protein
MVAGIYGLADVSLPASGAFIDLNTNNYPWWAMLSMK